jgi:hypothetical protein
MPDRQVAVDIPRSILPSLVLWLAESVGDPVHASLSPHHELLAQHDKPTVLSVDQPEMAVTRIAQVGEEDREADFEYEQS